MLVDRDRETEEADRPEDDRSINNELSEFTKYVEAITGTIHDMKSTANATFDQLIQATAHLNDLAKMTEEDTHRVLALTGAIETNRGPIRTALENWQKKLSGGHGTDVKSLVELVKVDERRLMDIHVALLFQDLVAQRVFHLATIRNKGQHKLHKLVIIFGIKKKKDGTSTKDRGRGNEMLRQLEVSQSTALDQDLVVDMLSEFGVYEKVVSYVMD